MASCLEKRLSVGKNEVCRWRVECHTVVIAGRSVSAEIEDEIIFWLLGI